MKIKLPSDQALLYIGIIAIAASLITLATLVLLLSYGIIK